MLIETSSLKVNSKLEIDESLIALGYRKYYSHYNNNLVENTYTESKLLELHKLQALDFSNDKIYTYSINSIILIVNQVVFMG